MYYGIAMDEKHLYVACRNEIEGPTDASARAKERGSILVFDAASLTLITSCARATSHCVMSMEQRLSMASYLWHVLMTISSQFMTPLRADGTSGTRL